MRGVQATVAALLVVAAGCTPDTSGGAGASPAPAAEVTTAPEVAIPDGSPPDEVEVQDLVEGAGAPVGVGDRLRVHFVAKSWDSGEVVESTWERAPYEFVLGSSAEIPGWNAALAGMRLGGQRHAIIPSQEAYEDRQPPGVGAGDTLVFVVQLVEIIEAP